MLNSSGSVNVLLSGSAAKLSNSSLVFVSGPRSPPLGSVQVHPEHQAVAEATNQEGEQVDGWDDVEGGRPVGVVAVEEGRGRR